MAKSTKTPAVVIQDLMDKYGLNPFSLSKGIHLTYSSVRLILAGKGRITLPIALRLAKFFDTDPSFWIGLQYAADMKTASSNKKLVSVLGKITKVSKTAAKPVAKGRKKTTLAGKRKKASKVPGAKPASRKRKK